MMNSKRRDRRQRRMEVKQALQQGTSSKRSGTGSDVRSSDIAKVGETSPAQPNPPTHPTVPKFPTIPKFGSRFFGSGFTESSATSSSTTSATSSSAKIFPFTEKTAASPDQAIRQAGGREQANIPQKRGHRQSNLASVPAMEAQPDAPQPPRLRSLPTPLSNPRPAAKPSILTSISLYTMRLMILGVGIGVIAGTFLHHWNPAAQSKPSKPTDRSATSGQSASQNTTAPFPVVKLTQPIVPLTTRIKALKEEAPELTPVVMVINAETGAYVDLDSTLGVPAASTIKVPILVAFFQDVDAGKIRLNEALTMRAELVASGSGEMQDKPVGTKFTAWETAVQMIITSDNTATNLLIDRMGGTEVLNQRFKAWGLTTTALRNFLPDLSGTNTTSARDLADLMLQINQGKLVSARSRDRIFSIMQRTRNNNLLPQGLGSDALIAHKTGDIGSIVGDVGLVDLPNGSRYIVAVLVKRPYNDASAVDLIHRISQVTHDYFGKPLELAKPTTSSSASPAKPANAATTRSNATTPSSTP